MRSGHRAAGVVACLAVTAVGILTTVVGSPGGRVLGGLVAVGGIAASVGWARSPVALVLDPAGVELPGALRPRRVAWDEIHDATVDGGWLPSVVLGLRGSSVTFRLAGQAWPPSAILAVLDHYRSARGRAERPGLTTAAAVDRFRQP